MKEKKQSENMATDVVDDREMREAQRDYVDFLDDDVSIISDRGHVEQVLF